MTLGQKIKAARLARGMTQKEVVGDYITRNMLSKIENDGAAPSVRTLERLAAALDIPVGYFLSGGEVSDGSVPDGLDEARAAFREKRWTDCLELLGRDKRAGTTDEGYLLYARAGTCAAREAMDRGEAALARELAEAAQYYNEEGLYCAAHLTLELSLILGEAFTKLGQDGYDEQRALFLRALHQLEQKKNEGR